MSDVSECAGTIFGVLHLGHRVEDVTRAREWIAKRVISVGPPGILDDVVLCASEVITNAVLHSRPGGSIVVVLVLSDTGVRVEVIDPGGDHVPHVREIDPVCETSGRGLHIVEALSSAWGHHRDVGGQAVWFEIGS